MYGRFFVGIYLFSSFFLEEPSLFNKEMHPTITKVTPKIATQPIIAEPMVALNNSKEQNKFFKIGEGPG